MRSHFLTRSAAFMAIAAMAACGGGGGGSSEGAADDAGEAAPAGAAVDPSTVGTITGMANFAGMVPAMEAIDMSAEEDCAAGYGADGPMNQMVMVSAGGGLANVFVYLSEGVSGAPAASGPAMLDQSNCRYSPHVLGVQSGQDIEITNSDNLLHNINATPTENRGFNISQPRAGITSTQRFQMAEVMVPVRCDVHGWMQAYIGVVDHPYFGVSGSDGGYTISNVPAGDYTLTAWHEEFGTMTASVTVTAGGMSEVSFDYNSDMMGANVPMGETLVIGHGTNRIRVERTQ
ncbi:carboxypeptidase regulatory-like domain-containing protein [Candidatus Palauibacter sp.]|uniref:carboxypeptidase regulatory-like domain-containing protein n=1 Tax=Candidatus Palauibacter sp. TaxID=3101350 RepID=UPI003AF2D58E